MSPVSLSEFADRMNEVMPVLIKEFARRQTDELVKGKITLPQFLILDFLHKKDKSKMKDMAYFMGVTTAAMTGIVDRLVREDYVERVYDSKDRRIIRIKLTSKGTKIIEKINQQRHQMIIKIFGKISPRERQDYLSILMHIRDILIKEKKA